MTKNYSTMRRLRKLRRTLTYSVFTICFTLLMLEIGLAVIGFPVGYNANYYRWREETVWGQDRICDTEVGCRFQHYEGSCETFRYGCVNSDGYLSAEFIPDAERYSIMVLGDSFMQGLGVRREENLWSLLNTEMPSLHAYNFGIMATGTGQAVAIARHYSPILEPDLIVLGFFVGNDYRDNLYPIDNLITIKTPPDHIEKYEVMVPSYDYNRVTKFTTPQEAFTRYLNLPICRNQVCELLMQTRVGTILLSFTASYLNADDWAKDEGIANTRRYLQDLQFIAAERQIPLLILVIPVAGQATSEHQQTLDLLTELNINYLDLLPSTPPEFYDGTSPRSHWTASGHRVAADAIKAYLEGFLGDF